MTYVITGNHLGNEYPIGDWIPHLERSSCQRGPNTSQLVGVRKGWRVVTYLYNHLEGSLSSASQPTKKLQPTVSSESLARTYYQS